MVFHDDSVLIGSLPTANLLRNSDCVIYTASNHNVWCFSYLLFYHKQILEYEWRRQILGHKQRVTVAEKYSVQNGYICIGLTDGYAMGCQWEYLRAFLMRHSTDIACPTSIVACCFCTHRVPASSACVRNVSCGQSVLCSWRLMWYLQVILRRRMYGLNLNLESVFLSSRFLCVCVSVCVCVIFSDRIFGVNVRYDNFIVIALPRLGAIQVLRNARGGGWVYAQALRSVTRGWGGGLRQRYVTSFFFS